jgi:hypothetical protein
MRIRNAVAVLAMSVFLASAAAAQTRGPELTVGVAALGSEKFGDDDSYTWLSTNEHVLRLAFYLSPKVAIEPDFSLSWWSGEGESSTQIGIGAFIPYYFNGDQGATGFYAAPGVGINMYSFDDGDDSDSASQTFFAIEAGKKFRLTESASFRVAAQYYMEPENDDFQKYSNIGVMLALSVFLK